METAQSSPVQDIVHSTAACLVRFDVDKFGLSFALVQFCPILKQKNVVNLLKECALCPTESAACVNGLDFLHSGSVSLEIWCIVTSGFWSGIPDPDSTLELQSSVSHCVPILSVFG